MTEIWVPDLEMAQLGEASMQCLEGVTEGHEFFARDCAAHDDPVRSVTVCRSMLVVELRYVHVDDSKSSIITYGASRSTDSRFDQEMLLRQARKVLKRNLGV